MNKQASKLAEIENQLADSGTIQRGKIKKN